MISCFIWCSQFAISLQESFEANLKDPPKAGGFASDVDLHPDADRISCHMPSATRKCLQRKKPVLAGKCYPQIISDLIPRRRGLEKDLKGIQLQASYHRRQKCHVATCISRRATKDQGEDLAFACPIDLALCSGIGRVRREETKISLEGLNLRSQNKLDICHYCKSFILVK